jgi:hypothetical protein
VSSQMSSYEEGQVSETMACVSRTYYLCCDIRKFSYVARTVLKNDKVLSCPFIVCAYPYHGTLWVSVC